MESSQSVTASRSDVRMSRTTEAASLGLRCGAFLIDYIMIMLALTVTLMLASWLKHSWLAPSAANVVVVLGYLATAGLVFYNWVFLYVQRGQSLGKNFIGLKVIQTDGANLDYKTSALRHIIGYPISLLCLGLGILWMLWDPMQQGWHDKLAKTIVVRV